MLEVIGKIVFSIGVLGHAVIGTEISERDSKLLNVFNIIKFPNEGCNTTAGSYGVCYTASECDSLGKSWPIKLSKPERGGLYRMLLSKILKNSCNF